jgi:hypothetical protein
MFRALHLLGKSVHFEPKGGRCKTKHRMDAATVTTTPSHRLTAVDALRGAVMIIMALDHTRDFIHAGAMSFLPDDLTRTTPALFLTLEDDKVSAVAAVPVDDARSIADRAGSSRQRSIILACAADRLRPSADVLLRGPLLGDSPRRVVPGLGAIWASVICVSFTSLAVDGRITGTLSTGLWLSALGGVRRLDWDRRLGVSALSLVCRVQAQPTRMVGELSVRTARGSSSIRGDHYITTLTWRGSPKMKSSMTTTSSLRASAVPKATRPLVIRTQAMRG